MKQSILFLFLSCISSYIFSQSYDVYISDAGNFNKPPWQIMKVDQNGENPVAFIQDNLSWPQDILFLEDQGVVLISNLTTGKITKYDADSGKFIENFALDIAGPTRTKIGPDGFLYVLQWRGDGKVLRYSLDGTIKGAFTDTGVINSIGLDWDSEGNLYVSSYRGKSVRKYGPDGKDQGLFISENLNGPTNIWFDQDGDLLVVDYEGQSIKRFSASGEYEGVYVSDLKNSEGVAYLDNGKFLLGNGATHSIKLIAPDGTIEKDFVPEGLGKLLTPNAVVVRKRQ